MRRTFGVQIRQVIPDADITWVLIQVLPQQQW